MKKELPFFFGYFSRALFKVSLARARVTFVTQPFPAEQVGKIFDFGAVGEKQPLPFGARLLKQPWHGLQHQRLWGPVKLAKGGMHNPALPFKEKQPPSHMGRRGTTKSLIL